MSAFRIGQRLEAWAFGRTEKPVPAKSDPARRKWCAIEVRSGSEDCAEAEIRALDYLTYMPRFKTEIRDRRNSRKRVVVQRPLFTGYLFAKIDPTSDPWRELERIGDVRGVVRTEDRPVVIPEVVIEGLREREPGNFAQPCRNADAIAGAFKPGDDVRLVDGNLVGFFAQVSSVDSRGRLTVLVDLFRRLTRLTVAVDQVERA